jgi:M6 family metalloprotease-like protein
MKARLAVLVVSALIVAASVQPAAYASPHQPSIAASLSGPTGFAAPEIALSGPQPFITLLCRFSDIAAEPAPPSYFEGLLGTTSPGLDDYWREVSYDQINLAGSRVAGWYTLPQPASTYQVGRGLDLDLDRLARDCTAVADADVYFPAFTGINLVFNSGGAYKGGSMWLDLDGTSRRYGITWIASASAQAQALFAHEMGHALGMEHSSANDGKEYRNAWDSMSEDGPCWPDPLYGSIAQHPIAYNVDQLGWIPADRRFIALSDSAASIHLERLAQPAPDGFLIARIPIPGQAGRFYTVEARRRAGYDAHLLADAVVIHEVDPARPLPVRLVSRGDVGTTVASMWTTGTRFVDPQGGIAVTVDADTATGFDVTIYTHALPWPMAPADMTLAPPGEVRFAWEPVLGAAGYEVQVNTVGGLQPAATINQQTSASEVVLSLQAGTYHWQVRALPDDTWSPASNLEVATVGRRWTPNGSIPGTQSGRPAEPAIAAGLSQGVFVAWADRRDIPVTDPIEMARASGGVWEPAGRSAVAVPHMGSESPALAASQQGDLYITWAAKPVGSHTPTEIWAARRGSNGAWEEGVRISDDVPATIRSEPTIVVDGAGGAYAIWQEYADSSSSIYFAHRPAGGDWGAAERVSDRSGTAWQGSPAIAVDAQGNAYALWVDTRAGHSDVYAAERPAGGRWEISGRFGDDFDAHAAPSLGVDAQGNAYATWGSYSSCRGKTGSVGQIDFAVKPAGGRWGSIGTVSSSVGGLELWNPAMAVSRDGSVFIAWQEADDSGFVLVSAYRPAGGVWGPKTPVSDGPGSAMPLQPAMAVDEKGNVLLVWVDYSTGSARLRIAATTSTPGI